MLAAMFTWVNPVYGHHESGAHNIVEGNHLKIEDGIKTTTRIATTRDFSVPFSAGIKGGFNRIYNSSPDHIATKINMREIMARRMMAPVEVAAICDQMDTLWLDHEKLEWAKEALYIRNITTGDLAKIIDRVGFEELKLELAKYAYTRVINKGDYTEIIAGFEFNSTGKELEQYIKDH